MRYDYEQSHLIKLRVIASFNMQSIIKCNSYKKVSLNAHFFSCNSKGLVP